MTKLRSIEQIPADLKAITEERLPEFFVAPPAESWGTENDSSFSVYAQENQPLPPLEK